MIPAQKQQILTWAERRDELLREIGLLETEKASKTTVNKELGSSNADLDKQIAEKKGILSQLEAAENRFRNSTANDIVELVARKSRLESEIETKTLEVKSLDEKKETLTGMLALFTSLHDTAFDRVKAIDHIVDRSRIVTEEQFGMMKEFLTTMKSMLDEVSSVHTETMKVGSLALDKFPRFIFEMQKPIPVRRVIDRRPIEETSNKDKK